jgi:hypothetical protein
MVSLPTRGTSRRFTASSTTSRTVHEKPRPGAAEVLDAGQKQRIIAMVCSDPPEGLPHEPPDHFKSVHDWKFQCDDGKVNFGLQKIEVINRFLAVLGV